MAGSYFNFLSKASWPGSLGEASLRADTEDSLQVAVESVTLLSRPRLSPHYHMTSVLIVRFSLHRCTDFYPDV